MGSNTAPSGSKFNTILAEGKALFRQTFSKLNESTEETINKLGINTEDLAKLDRVPLICAIASLIINIVLIASRYSVAWVKGTAMFAGEPFTVHASLSDVMFTNSGGVHVLTSKVGACSGYGDFCPLDVLAGDCEVPADLPAYEISGGLMTTSKDVWCQLRDTGGATLGLLWVGFVPGLIATCFTFMYAAKEISKVGDFFDMLAAKGFSSFLQKIVLSSSWGALWVFMFVSMTTFASGVPDSLGVAGTDFEASFGLLRLCFLLVSGFGALLITSLFELWNAENVAEAYSEFAETKFMTAPAKKLLYYLLFLQMILYMLLTIDAVHWEMLLVVIAGYYLDAKVKNFMLMYVAAVSVTILLDVIHIGGMPSFELMTPGESFCNVIYVIVFLSKFAVLGAIYFYEKESNAHAETFQRFDEVSPDEIAE